MFYYLLTLENKDNKDRKREIESTRNMIPIPERTAIKVTSC